MTEPNREKAEIAVRTLLEWIERSEGQSHTREGLIDTPE